VFALLDKDMKGFIDFEDFKTLFFMSPHLLSSSCQATLPTETLQANKPMYATSSLAATLPAPRSILENARPNSKQDEDRQHL